MKSRLQLPDPADMTPAQAAIHAEVLKTRGNAAGPFLAWLLSPGLATGRLRAMHVLAEELLATHALSDESYGRHVAELGEQRLVEVVGVIGCYALVAYTLNAFDMRLRWRPETSRQGRRHA